MKVTVDRFEGEFAVVELPDGSMVNMPWILSQGAKEGDVLIIKIDEKETAKRKEEINKLMNDLF